MKLRQLFADDDAVSPVIGVILMVAITVILAAVIGTFVLNLGQNVGDSAPSASFSYDVAANDDVTITLEATNQALDGGNVDTVNCDSDAFADSEEYTAGEDVNCGRQSSSGEIRIVWSSDETDKTATLGTFSP